MRTKTLLLTAAVLTAGLAASVAQSVYSVNAVGYVNKSLVAGYTLISNPLNGTNNSLNTILPIVPDDTIVLKWDAATQSFATPSQYYGVGTGWLPDTTLNPGEGAFINVPTPTTVTFVGEVPQGNLTNQISGNYTLLAHVVPQSISLSHPSVNFPVQDDDLVLFWDPATQNFATPLQYYGSALGWLPNEPVPAVAEGFFYNTAPSAARSWGRTFSVN